MAWDPVWEEIFKEQSWGRYPCEELVRFVALHFYKAPDREKVKLLEVGCGPGGNLWFMAKEGFTTYGIDGSPTAIRQARERLDLESPGWKGDLVVGDIKGLPFEDNFFDAVIDNEAVSCNSLEDAKAIYRELARVTKSKGKMYSRTFASGSWGDNVFSERLKERGYIRFTSFEEMQELVKGFNLIHFEILKRTVENRKHEVKEWIITAEKP